MSEICILDKEDIDMIVKDATIYGLGTLQVQNYGGCYAKMELGIYTVTKQGHTELRRTTDRKVLYKIFRQLISRYMNFERNGYAYRYDKGSWRRNRLKNQNSN